jgi:HEAT repeat protein
LRDSRAIPVLIRLLPDPVYGSEAIRALSRVGDYSALAPLVEQLSRANESTVRAIALALATIHERSLSRFGDAALVERVVQGAHHLPQLRRQLLSGLTRADSSEQLALMQVLSWVGEEGTVPHLLALLDTPGPVADGAVASLKRLRGSAEPQLIEALRVGNSARRRLLVPLLGGHLAAGAELAACLDDEDPTVRALACDALAHSGDTRHVAAIFPLLGDPDLRVSQAALAAIQSLGSVETKELALRAAYAENAQVRAAVLRVLGYFAYPEGLSALVAASRDPDESLRLAALSGLPLMDAPAALDAVLVARSHRSARTRAAAVRALGQMTDRPQVIDSLLAALSDPDPWVRYYACQSLGKARNESTTEALASLLGDGSGQVRVAAVEALAHLGGQRAFEVLAALMHAEDPDLFRAALVGLGISKRKEALKPLRLAAISPIAATRLVALSALGELGLPESVPIFASAAEDTDPGVRTAAEAFLAAHTHPSASAELLRLLGKDPSRESLIQALARPVPGRVDAVLAALRFADDALASALVSALARTHSEAANAGLRAAFASESSAARRAAAAALVASGDPLASQAIELAAVSDGDAEVRRICSAYLAR